MARYQEFMAAVKPALEAAGAHYLTRGGAHAVYEGDWQPRRIVLLEFPSSKAADDFYNWGRLRNRFSEAKAARKRR